MKVNKKAQRIDKEKRIYKIVSVSIDQRVIKLVKNYLENTGLNFSGIVERKLIEYIRECHDYQEGLKVLEKLDKNPKENFSDLTYPAVLEIEREKKGIGEFSKDYKRVEDDWN